MKPKLYAFLLIIVMLVAALWLVNRNKELPGGTIETKQPRTTAPATRTREPAPARGFNRKITRLEYTVHAKCRMKCRHITQEEINDIMKNGNINYTKSDLNDKPCPTYALEGYTMQDHQHVRVVFAQCNEKTKVVTCIDLEEDFACACK